MKPQLDQQRRVSGRSKPTEQKKRKQKMFHGVNRLKRRSVRDLSPSFRESF